MKVLLDEHLDHRLRRDLGDHEVFTVAYMGWSGLKNGELLLAMETAGFDVLVTGDQTLHWEQNLAARKVALVVLTSIEYLILKNHVPAILAALDQVTPGVRVIVNCGTFQRRATI